MFLMHKVLDNYAFLVLFFFSNKMKKAFFENLFYCHNLLCFMKINPVSSEIFLHFFAPVSHCADV